MKLLMKTLIVLTALSGAAPSFAKECKLFSDGEWWLDMRATPWTVNGRPCQAGKSNGLETKLYCMDLRPVTLTQDSVYRFLDVSTRYDDGKLDPVCDATFGDVFDGEHMCEDPANKCGDHAEEG